MSVSWLNDKRGAVGIALRVGPVAFAFALGHVPTLDSQN